MNVSFCMQYILFTCAWLVPVIFYYHLTKINTYFQWNLGWIFCVYFTYRYWFPATRWDAFRNWIISLNLGSYYKNAKIIGRKQTTSDNTLYLWYSNSFLSPGFINYGLTHPSWDNCKPDSPGNSPKVLYMEWLVPKHLLRFPILTDILRWLGCTENTSENLQQKMFTGKQICVLLSEETQIENSPIDPECFKTYINLAITYGYNISIIHTVGEESEGLQLSAPLKSLLWKASLPLNFVFKQLPEPRQRLVTFITPPVKIIRISDAKTSVVDYYLDKIIKTIPDINSHPRAETPSHY